MPLSNDKPIADILYSHLPGLYKQQDIDAQPIPFPLKRFLQVASKGLEQVESEIDGLKLLFDMDFTPEKYLDPIANMLGFTFPTRTTIDEKRRLLRNLPNIYKLKGNDLVFDMLARLVFHKDAKTYVIWKYTDTGSSMIINLEIAEEESIEGLDLKRELYLELVEYFRPVNVGMSWVMYFFYTYEYRLTPVDEQDLTLIHMNDDYDFKYAKDNPSGLLNFSQLNYKFKFYTTSTVPEQALVMATDEHTDTIVVL